MAEELRNRRKLGGEESGGTTPESEHIASGTENQRKEDKNEPASASNRQFSMSEYCQSLRTWVFMYQSHMYIQQHMMNMVPYMACATYMQQLQQQQSTVSSTSASATGQSSGGVAGGRPVGDIQQQQQQQNVQQNPPDRGGFAFGFRQHHLNAAQNVDNVIPQIPVLEFSVPSIFRRVVAEMIDFFLLFTAKLGFMLVIIDYLGISSDTTGFMMRFLVEEIEDDTSLEELQQMLLFAFVYRVIVCMYETFFLCSHVNRFLAGATPGKFLMRLRVISLEQVQSAGPGRVQVTLPDNISFTQAFLRSVVKNFSMAFFFPACVTVFFNPHFRAAYEVLTRTMVVGAENWPDLGPNRQVGDRPLVR
ncbi:uncharacterized protein [Diadema antillarum]|uniref:uncharacterized protein isoform X1 n=1 Tax=Diadema antillarum TaxID=105358 RepID=UPI003A87F390